MSSPAIRELPRMGSPLSLAMPGIVERASSTPIHRLTLGADTGPGVNLPSHRPVDLSSLVPITEPAAAEAAPETVRKDEPAVSATAVEPASPESALVADLPEVSTSGLTAIDEFDPAIALPPTAKAVKAIKRFSLIDPNQPWVMYVAIGLLGGILMASLVSSFTSVYAMAAWVGLPAAVQWLPVVILDVAILGFSWALMVFSSRLADPDPAAENQNLVREKVGSTRLWLILVTSFSVVANFLHTYDYWDGDISTPQAIMGAVFSSAIPLMALVSTETLIRLVFIRRKRVHTEGSEL